MITFPFVQTTNSFFQNLFFGFFNRIRNILWLKGNRVIPLLWISPPVPLLDCLFS